MRALLSLATDYSVMVIDAIALLVIVLGTLEALARGLAALRLSPNEQAERGVLLRYGHWLVAGLTFQLAADIIETSTAPNWEDIGRIAAIAVIRTFLNFFLERDLEEARNRPSQPATA